MAGRASSGDVGVVTMDCYYCESTLKNVGAKTAYQHIFMCAARLTKHVVEVRLIQGIFVEI